MSRTLVGSTALHPAALAVHQAITVPATADRSCVVFATFANGSNVILIPPFVYPYELDGLLTLFELRKNGNEKGRAHTAAALIEQAIGYAARFPPRRDRGP
jgi:hypothetical protein